MTGGGYARGGNSTYPRPPLEKFEERYTVAENGCWLWTAHVKANGYASFCVRRGIQMNAHRWSYENAHGRLPEDIDLHHLCKTRHCVNHAHLLPVTAKEHSTIEPPPLRPQCIHGHPLNEVTAAPHRPFARARFCRVCQYLRNRGLPLDTPARYVIPFLNPYRPYDPTRCRRGHLFTPENTIWVKKEGQICGRTCRACDNERQRRRYARRKSSLACFAIKDRTAPTPPQMLPGLEALEW